jgi:hypothetical protein
MEQPPHLGLVLRSRPAYRVGKDNVFELDDRGLVARQFSPERVKLREQHTNPKTGQVHEKWSEKVAVSKADLNILRKMGVIK